MVSMSNEQNTLNPFPCAFNERAYMVTGKLAEQDWAKKHNRAMANPIGWSGDEERILLLIKAVHDAAVAFPACGFGLPEVLLPMIQAARAALNFETGHRLDCGTLDRGLVALANGLGIADEDL